MSRQKDNETPNRQFNHRLLFVSKINPFLMCNGVLIYPVKGMVGMNNFRGKRWFFSGVLNVNISKTTDN